MGFEDRAKELEKVTQEFFLEKSALFEEIIEVMVECLRSGQKILVFGNGGSAAQAQHFASELVNKFLKQRPALPALSLTTDTSALTSIANDGSFDQVFSRQIQALGEKGDVALGLSTSGNSPNVIEAFKDAKQKEIVTVALTGEGGGRMSSLPDFLLEVPSTSTPRIQEVHLLLLHLLAEEIEIRLD
jgi:D-sedoheptulose 7-phosphate isomerase